MSNKNKIKIIPTNIETNIFIYNFQDQIGKTFL